jgi:hypothetical protein
MAFELRVRLRLRRHHAADVKALYDFYNTFETSGSTLAYCVDSLTSEDQASGSTPELVIGKWTYFFSQVCIPVSPDIGVFHSYCVHTSIFALP